MHTPWFDLKGSWPKPKSMKSNLCTFPQIRECSLNTGSESGPTPEPEKKR